MLVAGGGAIGARKLYANARPLDIAGQGEWHDNTIRLTSLSTGFDQLHYGAMTVTSPRLALNKPIVWVRDATTPSLQGALSWWRGNRIYQWERAAAFYP